MSLQESIAKLGRLHQKVVVFSTGPEGSGKTTLMKGIKEACPQAGIILFSTVLSSYLKYLKSLPDDSGHTCAVAETENAMSIRDKKGVPYYIAFGALCHGMRECSFRKYNFVFVDGWPRTLEQSGDSPKIVGEYFPDSLLVSLEAVCSRKESYRRAIARDNPTDTEDLINICHDEYFGQLEQMRSSFGGWSHHLQAVTEGSPKETLENLGKVFSDFVQEIQGGLPRLVATSKAFALS